MLKKLSAVLILMVVTQALLAGTEVLQLVDIQCGGSPVGTSIRGSVFSGSKVAITNGTNTQFTFNVVGACPVRPQAKFTCKVSSDGNKILSSDCNPAFGTKFLSNSELGIGRVTGNGGYLELTSSNSFLSLWICANPHSNTTFIFSR